MTRPTVAIGALGGTIASMPSTVSATGGGEVVPTLGAGRLAAAVPGLGEIADLRAETLAQLPSPSLDEPTILRALAWAGAAVDDGATGVVITQGTDTLEESAYLLDLLWNRSEPLVVTGAMRPPQAPGADGPANLLAAVRCALAPASRERGVLAVLDDEVHRARWVAKTDTTATGAFASPGFGPVGRCVEGAIGYAGPPVRDRPLTVPPSGSSGLGSPRVPLLTTYLGDDGRVLDVVRESGVDGVVIAGFGAGHVSAAMAEAVGRAAASLPVVLASRTGSGPTARSTYGYPGAEVDLLARGAIGAGWLPPLKARVLLWTLLATGVDDERLRAELEVRGRLS